MAFQFCKVNNPSKILCVVREDKCSSFILSLAWQFASSLWNYKLYEEVIKKDLLEI